MTEAAHRAAPIGLLVVRPRAQAGGWVGALRALGVDAQALPLIEILPAPEPARVGEAFADMERLAAIASSACCGEDAVESIDSSARPLLVFVSPNAVSGFFAAAATVRAWPDDAWAAATGPGTVAALRAAGVPAHRIVAPPADAAQFDSEALWQRVAGWAWTDRPVWLVRGNGGRDWLGQQMRERGASVRVVQSYRRDAPALTHDERALLAAAVADPARWAWLFSSSEAIDHLVALAPDAPWHAGHALASHPRIAERARSAGFVDVAVVAPTAAAVAAALGAAQAG